jgi:hypothetical protein
LGKTKTDLKGIMELILRKKIEENRDKIDDLEVEAAQNLEGKLYKEAIENLIEALSLSEQIPFIEDMLNTNL